MAHVTQFGGFSYVLCGGFLDESELSFLNNLIAFARQMNGLKLTEPQLALLSALVLLNPSWY